MIGYPKIKKRILFSILFLLSSLVQAQSIQESSDSLLTEIYRTNNDITKIELYNKLIFLWSYEDPKMALEYAAEGLKIIDTLDYDVGYINFYSDIGAIYGNWQQDAKALDYYLKSLKYLDEYLAKPNASPNLLNVKSNVLNNLSLLLFTHQRIDEAEDYTIQALKISEKTKSKQREILSLLHLSQIYIEKNLASTADSLLKKALQTSVDLGYKEYSAISLAGLGYLSNDVKTKIEYRQQAKKMWEDMSEENLNSHNNLLGLSEVYLELLTNDSLYFSANSGLNREQMIDESYDFIEESIILSKRLESKRLLMDAYKLKSQLYKIQGNYKNAYEYSMLYHSIYDSIFSQENKNTLAMLESQNEINLRDKEIEINKTALLVKKKQLSYFVAGTILLIIILVLLFYQNRLRLKNNRNLRELNDRLSVLNDELEKANLTKSRFLNILNHDLRAPVSTLIGYLYLLKDNSEILEEENQDEMISEIIGYSENLLNSMEDLLLWTKQEMKNFKPKLKEIPAQTIFNDILKYFSGKNHVQIIFQDPENIILRTDENILKTIIRNLTANSIRALEEIKDGEIIWKAYYKGKKIILSIEDNAGGNYSQFASLYDENNSVDTKSGLGLHLVRDLAGIIQCEIRVNTSTMGTVIKLFLHINPPEILSADI